MATIDDLNSTGQNIARQIGQWISAVGSLSTATLGMTRGGTAVPAMTIQTALGTSSMLVISANSARLGIAFISANLSNSNISLTTSNITAVAGRGVFLTPGNTVTLLSNCAWNAIATSGSSNVLTILEFT